MEILEFLITNMPIICGISYAIALLLAILSKKFACIFPLIYSAAVGAFLIYYRYYHSNLHEGTIKTEEDFLCMLGISLFCAMVAGAVFTGLWLFLEIDSCGTFLFGLFISLILIPIVEIVMYYLLILALGLILTAVQGDYSRIVLILIILGALTPPASVIVIVFKK